MPEGDGSEIPSKRLALLEPTRAEVQRALHLLHPDRRFRNR